MKVCTTLQGEESSGGFHDSMSSLGPVAFTCKSRTRPGAGMKSRGSGMECEQWNGCDWNGMWTVKECEQWNGMWTVEQSEAVEWSVNSGMGCG